MKTRRLGLAVLPLVVAAMGCSHDIVSAERDPTAPIQTGDLSYALLTFTLEAGVGVAAGIDYAFTNVTSGPVVVDDCATPAMNVAKKVGSQWQTVWSGSGDEDPGEEPCEGTLRLLPGEVFADTLLLTGGLPGGDIVPLFSDPDPGGIYRLEMSDVRRDEAGGTLLPQADRTSNEFKLTTFPAGVSRR